MGYSETMCQLCGVSFAIARYRRPDEPFEAAWTYYGHDFNEVDDPEELQKECKDCEAVARPGANDLEHVAGPHCVGTNGYSGWRISLEEMMGCRAVQCLAWKDEDWEPEKDDQDFEVNSQCFLTGIGDGSPDEASLADLTPSRHGLHEVIIANVMWDDNDAEWGLPFHPTCFRIFSHMSQNKFGHINIDGLWRWRSHERTFENFFEHFPRDPAVRQGQEQWWEHEPGCEYLVANPISIPGLEEALRSAATRSTTNPNSPLKVQDDASNLNGDPFRVLPGEITDTILSYLTSGDVVSLRLSSRSFRQLPKSIFRRLLAEEKEWLWELESFPADSNWYELWIEANTDFGSLKGMRNRRRVWKDVLEILTRITNLDGQRRANFKSS